MRTGGSCKPQTRIVLRQPSPTVAPMFPDLGPLILFGVWCFCILVGLVLGVVAFFVTDWRWAILVGAAAGQIGFMLFRAINLKD